MKKIFLILTVIFFSSFVLFVSLLAERYFKLSAIELRKETLNKETFRRQNLDRKLIKKALNDGYFPIVYPYTFKEHPFLKLVDDLPPLGANPHTNHYLCNEGYGLIKLKSDRFGLRNDDEIWDNINLLKNKVLLVGDSFAHGACVEKKDSIAGNINGNVFNIAMGANDPHIYNASVNVFSNLMFVHQVMRTLRSIKAFANARNIFGGAASSTKWKPLTPVSEIICSILLTKSVAVVFW